MTYARSIGGMQHVFASLKELMAKAPPPRAGDRLAGLAAETAEENVATKLALADMPLKSILAEPLIPHEDDDVTRQFLDRHDVRALAPIAHLTVGEFPEHLLSHGTTPDTLAALAPGIRPEMAAALSKLMRNQDPILAARKCRVVTSFRSTLGLLGTMAVRLLPNHPTDDLAGIVPAIADGMMYGDPVLPIIIAYRDNLIGRDWAYGFLHGIEFHATLGQSGKEARRTDRLIDPILALAGPEVYRSDVSASRREKLLDGLPDAILRCVAAWRPSAVPGPTSEPVRSAKVGRNDPCPCGSGKKYKKCCGGGSAETVH
jgi:hypothetical protein